MNSILEEDLSDFVDQEKIEDAESVQDRLEKELSLQKESSFVQKTKTQSAVFYQKNSKDHQVSFVAESEKQTYRTNPPTQQRQFGKNTTSFQQNNRLRFQQLKDFYLKESRQKWDHPFQSEMMKQASYHYSLLLKKN